MTEPLLDAHNHLQDARLDGIREEVVATCRESGVARMVVNGVCEADWPAVSELARRWPDLVLPSFGVHPWHVGDCSEGWFDTWVSALDSQHAVIGEIGLDRWVEGHDIERQREVFLRQWRLARERDLPVTVHCLRAWGHLMELLRSEPAPPGGFLLHSYGGPVEMVDEFAKLGAYFSLSGYFAHDRKAKQRETFKSVPPERLLLETDAPDMWPPKEWNRHPLREADDQRELNHPANLAAVYDFAAEFLAVPRPELEERVRENFTRLFGSSDR